MKMRGDALQNVPIAMRLLTVIKINQKYKKIVAFIGGAVMQKEKSQI